MSESEDERGTDEGTEPDERPLDGGALRIPAANLSPEALRGIAEAFVLREGTDYGPHEHGFEQKVEQVLDQIRRGDAWIAFDPETETVNVLSVD